MTCCPKPIATIGTWATAHVQSGLSMVFSLPRFPNLQLVRQNIVGHITQFHGHWCATWLANVHVGDTVETIHIEVCNHENLCYKIEFFVESWSQESLIGHVVVHWFEKYPGSPSTLCSRERGSVMGLREHHRQMFVFQFQSCGWPWLAGKTYNYIVARGPERLVISDNNHPNPRLKLS